MKLYKSSVDRIIDERYEETLKGLAADAKKPDKWAFSLAVGRELYAQATPERKAAVDAYRLEGKVPEDADPQSNAAGEEKAAT